MIWSYTTHINYFSKLIWFKKRHVTWPTQDTTTYANVDLTWNHIHKYDLNIDFRFSNLRSVCIYKYIYNFFCCRSKERKKYFKMSRSMKRFVFSLGFICLFCSYIHVCFQLVTFIREHIYYKALLMGYSVGLELTRVCSFDGFLLFMVYMEGNPLIFFKYV